MTAANTLSLPFITLLVTGTLAAGIFVARSNDGFRARWVAVAWTAVLLGFGMWTSALVYTNGAPQRWVEPLALPILGAARPMFGVDALNAALLPFSAFVALATFVGTPHRVLTNRRTGAALIQLGGVWGLFASLDLALAVVFWTVGLLPVLLGRARPSALQPGLRLTRVYLLGSAGLMVIAVGLIAAAGQRAGLSAPLSLLDLANQPLERTEIWSALPFLLVAVLLRKGAFPFQSWIPAIAERFHPPLVSALVVPQVGSFVLVRFAIPLFPHAMAEVLPIVARVALVGVLYGSIAALTAPTLRRAFGWLAASHSALVLVGLECVTPDGVAGGLTLWISEGIALTGLAIGISAVEARAGEIDLRRFHGLAEGAPWLAGAFLFLGLAAVGLPGTLGFVAEDLLVHGVLDSYPGIGSIIVVAAAVNGFTVVRCFLRTFYGPPASAVARVHDVRAPERLALIGLALPLLIFGLAPEPVTATRVPTAIEIASMLGSTPTPGR